MESRFWIRSIHSQLGDLGEVTFLLQASSFHFALKSIRGRRVDIMPVTCDVKCRQVASVMLISPCGRRVPISRPALWLSRSLYSDSVSRSGASRRSLVGLGGPWPRVPLLLFFQAGPQGRALFLKTSPLVSPSAGHRAAESLSSPRSPIFPEK